MKLQFTRILTHQFSHKLVNVLLNLFVHKIYLKNKTIGLLLACPSVSEKSGAKILLFFDICNIFVQKVILLFIFLTICFA